MAVFGRAATAWANAGPSETSVNVVAEPVGIRDVRIEHEILSIDLRPLEMGDPAIVEAVYHLENGGPEQTLDLLFGFGTQENSDFHITLDRQTIPGEVVETDMPGDWTPPRFTPGLDGGEDLTYAGGWSTVRPMSFTTVVPPGSSELSVRYLAAPKYTYARPAMYRQFAYVLSPARAWAGFGGLDVTIHVPEDWSVASTPALERAGELLTGRFDDVPADAIGLTLRPPIADGYRLSRNIAWGLFALVGIAGVVCCWRRGGRGFLRAAGMGLACGAAVFVTGLGAAHGVDALFPPTATEAALVNELRLSDGYGRLATLADILLLSVLTAVVGCVLGLIRTAEPMPDSSG